MADKIRNQFGMSSLTPMHSSAGNSKKACPKSPNKKDGEDIWDRTPVISRLNSLECWDYTIELECLAGTQG